MPKLLKLPKQLGFFQKLSKRIPFLQETIFKEKNEKHSKITKKTKRVEIQIFLGHTSNVLTIHYAGKNNKKSSYYQFNVCSVDVHCNDLVNECSLQPIPSLTSIESDASMKIKMENNLVHITLSIKDGSDVAEVIEFSNVEVLSLENLITYEYLSFAKGCDRLRLQKRYAPIIFSKN